MQFGCGFEISKMLQANILAPLIGIKVSWELEAAADTDTDTFVDTDTSMQLDCCHKFIYFSALFFAKKKYI